jgi:hypothetical protein
MFGAAVSLAALLGAAAAAGGTASAATPTGVGTTKATTTALNVALGKGGSLLNVRVLGDDGSANIDPKQGSPSSAGSALSPLTSTSSVSQLNLSLPKVSVSSTGAADNKSVPGIDLTTLLTTGSISPLSLSAVVDSAQGAASGLNSSLKNVTAVAGLLRVPSATSNLGAAAKPGDADGLRGLSVPSIQVLNLGAVLQGLGINPGTLSVDQLGNALNTLNITLPNGTSTLTGAQLAALGTQLTTLQAVADQTTPLSSLPVNPTSTINGLLPPGTTLPATPTVSDAVASITNQLKALLPTALTDLANAPLLQVNDLVVGITTKAADTVANSAADIKASLGSVQVGNLSVPGVDLAAVLTNANTTINNVLTQVGLGNLITVKALDQSKSVGTQNGYVNALANLTGVHVEIAPLSSLTGGTALAAPPVTVGGLLGAGNVPVLSQAMATLSGLPGMPAVGALATGATVDVLSVGAASAFVPASSSTPSNPAAATPQNGTLAVTGGPTQILGFVGLLLLATVAGLRWLRRPATSN